MKVNTEENGNPELLFSTVNTYHNIKGSMFWFYCLCGKLGRQARQES
jgi:hypothetical protein